MRETVKHVEILNLPIRQLRQRLFVKRGTKLFPDREYTFLDDVPEQIERLKGFTNWESFSEEWDILWVGLDPRTIEWIPGRHNSPFRQTVAPLTIVKLDDRTKRMQVPAELRQIIAKMELPVKKEQLEPETDEDRAISDSLSGRVVVDEPDNEKAIRLIEENMKMLQQQLAVLTRSNK